MIRKNKSAQARWDNAVKRYKQSPSKCLYCGLVMEFKDGDQPSELKRKKFCSRSHAASYNNSLHIKRTRIGPKPICRICGGFVSDGSITCITCLKKENLEKVWALPIRDYIIRTASKVKYSWIRKWAKIYIKTLGIKKCCSICEYDKIVEVCHLKPLKSFSEDTLMGVVNHKDNLKYMCPNHHAELDKGLLVLENIV
jgi:hypothetical protein